MTTPEPRELPDWWDGPTPKNPNYRHGHATSAGLSPAYVSWKNMLQRCQNPNNTAYARYGGRGITVCDGWQNFPEFLRDMGEPCVGESLDRINNNSGYFPGNCRWATSTVQAQNQRLRHDNRTGIKGVVCQQNRWYASVRVNGKLKYLYSGLDFFDACCARKSWEAKNGGQ